MAGSFSDYLENALLDYTFGATAFTPSGMLHLALSLADPTDDGSGLDEPLAASGYARAAIDNDKTTWSNAAAGALSNDIEITWPEATGDWSLITHLAIMCQSSGGPCLGAADLNVAKTILSGDTGKISVGNLDISLV